MRMPGSRSFLAAAIVSPYCGFDGKDLDIEQALVGARKHSM